MALYGHPSSAAMGNYMAYSEYNGREGIPRIAPPGNVPQSPTPSTGAGVEDEDLVRASTKQPDPACHVFDGRIYGLKVVQQPQRARMCGFGDKDRRPISSPPIVQLIILDEATKQEIDYTDNNLELSHFVCQVDIYNKDGSSPKNLLRSSQSGSSISMTTTSDFPVTQITRPPEVHAQRLSPTDPAHRLVHGPHPSPYGNHYPPAEYNQYPPNPYAQPNPGYPPSQSSHGTFPPSYGPPRHFDAYAAPQAANPYDESLQHRAPPSNQQTGYPTSRTTPSHQYGGASHSAHSSYSAQNAPPPGPYTDTHTMQPNYSSGRAPPTPPADGPTGQQVKVDRNLIGTLCTSAVLLKDLEEKDGIFFIWGDLSVRTEDWFSLKFSFFNVGEVLRDASWEELAARARTAKTYPSDPPKEGTARSDKSLSGIRAPLLAKTAPCLATVFSQCFRVFSAKKFPGVLESTRMNAHFAKQGVKITVRNDKDNKRKRDEEDGYEEL